MQFLSIFRKNWWLRTSKTIKKETIRCPGSFFEEIKAICVEKMHQIRTEIDKNTKKISQFLCSICVILESVGGFEFQRRSTRNKLVVKKAFLGNERSFVMKKTHNLRLKMTITSKCTDFSRFHATFANL